MAINPYSKSYGTLALSRELSKYKKQSKKISIPKVDEEIIVDTTANEEYNKKLNEYNKAVKEQQEWEQAYKIVRKRARYDPKSRVGKKVDLIYKTEPGYIAKIRQGYEKYKLPKKPKIILKYPGTKKVVSSRVDPKITIFSEKTKEIPRKEINDSYWDKFNLAKVKKKEESIEKPMGTVTKVETPKWVWHDPYERLSFELDKSRNIYLTKKWRNQANALDELKRGGMGIVGGIAGLTYPFRHPIKTGKGIYTTIKNPSTILEEGSKIGYIIEEDPAYALTYGSTIFLGPKALKGTLKGGSNLIKSTGAKYVPPEKVFDIKVLKGKKTFPTTSSPLESIRRFKKAKEGKYLVGQHSTPIRWSKKTITKGGIRGEKGLYITPRGEGSPFFLRIPEKSIEYKFTINPLKALRDIKSNPSVIRIKYNDIRRLPSNIRNSQGFKEVNNYLSKNRNRGVAYITKGSEKGRTPEIEAVIPEGTNLKSTSGIRGYKYYTKYNGKVVPIRDYKILSKIKNDIRGLRLDKKLLNKMKNYEKNLEYYYKKGNIKYESPYEYIRYKYNYKKPFNKRSYNIGGMGEESYNIPNVKYNYKNTPKRDYKINYDIPYYPSIYGSYQYPSKYKSYPMDYDYQGGSYKLTPKETTIKKKYEEEDKKKKYKFKKKKIDTRLLRITDPYYRITGQRKYSVPMLQMIRKRYGNVAT